MLAELIPGPRVDKVSARSDRVNGEMGDLVVDWRCLVVKGLLHRHAENHRSPDLRPVVGVELVLEDSLSSQLRTRVDVRAP